MKIYYKNKILLNGLIPLIDFKVDNYNQKTEKYDEKIINNDCEDFVFYSAGHLMNSCYSCKEKEGIYYEYLENDELFECEIDDKYKGKTNEIQNILIDKISEEVNFLEKKFRLITGLKIGMPVFKATIYDENKDFFTYVGSIVNQTSSFRIANYDDNLKNILLDRLKFHISNQTLQNLEENNIRFKRALNFYNKSFLYDDIGISITLLFSSLEALFNIDGEDITNTVSHYTSKIMFLDKKKEKSVKWKIINFYKKRSNYIHGNDIDDPITSKDEFDLRSIVREVLIIYWNLSLNYQITKANDIKDLIDNLTNDKLDVKVQMLIKYLRTNPIEYSTLYTKISNKLKQGDMSILSDKNI